MLFLLVRSPSLRLDSLYTWGSSLTTWAKKFKCTHKSQETHPNKVPSSAAVCSVATWRRYVSKAREALRADTRHGLKPQKPRVCKRWFQTMVRVWSGEQISAPHLTFIWQHFYLCSTSTLLPFYLILTSAQPATSNHGLETTVYRPMEKQCHRLAQITWLRGGLQRGEFPQVSVVAHSSASSLRGYELCARRSSDEAAKVPQACPLWPLWTSSSRLQWGCSEGVANASCGESVVQNAKMDSNVFSISSTAFRCFKSQPCEGSEEMDSPKTPFGRLFSCTTPSPLFWRLLNWRELPHPTPEGEKNTV